jgi:hypothetical protein
MYHLTTFTEIDGKKRFKHYDARNKQQAENEADRKQGQGKWKFYAGKNKVLSCAQSSELSQTLKVL